MRHQSLPSSVQIIVSYPTQRHTITLTNIGMWLIGANFSNIGIKIESFSQKCRLQMAAILSRT